MSTAGKGPSPAGRSTAANIVPEYTVAIRIHVLDGAASPSGASINVTRESATSPAAEAGSAADSRQALTASAFRVFMSGDPTLLGRSLVWWIACGFTLSNPAIPRFGDGVVARVAHVSPAKQHEHGADGLYALAAAFRATHDRNQDPKEAGAGRGDEAGAKGDVQVVHSRWRSG